MKKLPWILFRQLLETFRQLFYPNIWSHCPGLNVTDIVTGLGVPGDKYSH